MLKKDIATSQKCQRTAVKTPQARDRANYNKLRQEAVCQKSSENQKEAQSVTAKLVLQNIKQVAKTSHRRNQSQNSSNRNKLSQSGNSQLVLQKTATEQKHNTEPRHCRPAHQKLQKRNGFVGEMMLQEQAFWVAVFFFSLLSPPQSVRNEKSLQNCPPLFIWRSQYTPMRMRVAASSSSPLSLELHVGEGLT